MMLGLKISVTLLLWLNLAAGGLEVEVPVIEEDKLIFTHIIYRHGDRNPLVSYPNDPWKDESNWPGGYGELINDGKRRQHELGKYFRERYRSLLGDGAYSLNITYIQSTDDDRTIMSAQSNLAGLFLPKGDQVWNDNLVWQPIPGKSRLYGEKCHYQRPSTDSTVTVIVHTIPKNFDHVLGAERFCARYNDALKRYQGSPEFQAIFTKHKALLDYLEENTGLTIRTLDEVQNLNDTLWIESITNKTLPEWTKTVFPGGDLEMLAAKSFQTNTSTPELARLKSGFLIREILNRFTNKIESKLMPDRSIWIYSAHDSTIASVLNSLALFELHTPPYASSLLFELYKSKNGFYFQLFYKKWSNENPSPLNIPKCGTKCTLEKFREAYRAIIPTGSYEEECGLLPTVFS